MRAVRESGAERGWECALKSGSERAALSSLRRARTRQPPSKGRHDGTPSHALRSAPPSPSATQRPAAPAAPQWENTTTLGAQMASARASALCCGGEGLMNTTVTGPGQIFIQTYTVSRFQTSMARYYNVRTLV